MCVQADAGRSWLDGYVDNTRDVPDDVAARLKRGDAKNGRSMKHEVRELLSACYPGRAEVLDRVRSRWEEALPSVSGPEVDRRGAGPLHMTVVDTNVFAYALVGTRNSGMNHSPSSYFT